jgi:predicted ATPase
MDLAIRLLGPVELIRDGTVVVAGGPTQRAVLAMLALHAGQPVAIDDLVDGIWGERDSSPGGRATIWPHVSRLRAILGAGNQQPLVTVAGGYRLEADAVSVDVLEFDRRLEAGRGQLADGDATGALATLEQALTLWRGPALLDVRDFPFAAGVAARYDELRVDAAEERIEARLVLDEARALLPELHRLIGENPYRERLRGQLMLALYRAGQQAAALEAYQAARRQLTLDLGVEPGPALEALHHQILAHAEGLVSPVVASPGPASERLEQARRRLPRAPDLIGRAEQLRELERLAAGERLVTLTGAGGSGKTALALALAHRLAPRFPDGAAFVDLAAVSRPEQIIPATAAALGLSPTSGGSASRLAEYLADRQTLVVLDNVEAVADAFPDLEAIVAATGGLVLATSRSPLGLHDEHLVVVPPLPVPDVGASRSALIRQPAVRLFRRAAASAGGDAGVSPLELAAIGDICRAVDGLPLAIEITASQTRVEAVQELAMHVRDELPGLRARARHAPARQQTLDSAIGWSIDRLAAEHRPRLYRLTVFAGSFEADGAAAVCDLTGNRTLDLLTALLNASLLTRQPAVEGRARFRILQPVRAVACARADPALLADAARRHADFMAAEVDRLCPRATGIQRPADLRQLRLSHHDLMAALGHLATEDPDACAGLAHQLRDYWAWTGREADAKRVVDELLASGRLSDRAACTALVVSGWVAFVLGQLPEGKQLIDRAIVLAEHTPDAATNAIVYRHEAVFASASGDVPRSQAAKRAAVDHAREAGLPSLLALCLALPLPLPSTAQTQDWFDEARQIADAGPMPYVQAWVLGSIAVQEEQNLVASIHLERSALEICNRFRAPESSLTTSLMANLAAHLLRSGSVDEARPLALASLHAADRQGYRVWASFAMGLLGEIEAAAGRGERAMALIAASRASEVRLGATGMSTDSETRHVRELIRRLEAQLGGRRAAVARRRGEAMSYRDGVAYAFEVSRPRRRGRRARDARARGRRLA